MDLDHIKKLRLLFRNQFGAGPSSDLPLAPSGSNRSYYRLTKGNISVVGAYNPNVEENKAFFYLTAHFDSKHLPVPHLIAISECQTCYLVSDLGSQSLFDIISNLQWENETSTQAEHLINLTLRSIVNFQVEGAKALDFNQCYPTAEFNMQQIHWDLNYFKYCFLKPSGIEFSEVKLEDDFTVLSHQLREAPSNFFMFRDFQSRNVMISEDKPYFIDYQGGSKGPALYDIASFLYQARANLPQWLRQKLFNTYLDYLSQKCKIDTDTYRKLLPSFVLFRTLQTLGAYGFRGFFERKSHFLMSIPRVAANIGAVLQMQDILVPHLSQILKNISVKYSEPPPAGAFDGLTVHISSFSFKKGYPAEHPEHGGGFVFDCRGLPNPGRTTELASLTGLDKTVANYLARQGEVLQFLEKTKSILLDTIEKYKQRGFQHLSISFGCTGGQHRSVYMASRTANFLNQVEGIRVIVTHRELEK